MLVNFGKWLARVFRERVLVIEKYKLLSPSTLEIYFSFDNKKAVFSHNGPYISHFRKMKEAEKATEDPDSVNVDYDIGKEVNIESILLQYKKQWFYLNESDGK